ncbi:alpha/beta hydrolase [Fundicoccus sp. Sow4_F4]|uniref:alpha/beta hydrolase n=1 Tax=Fundicoccus sp. Sow4_F4 TaxID=3438783 RepID=UPI003F933373
MTYSQEIYTFASFKELPLQASFYRPSRTQTYLATLIYFHGGGLIFGQRDDLPEVYIEQLTGAGYGILAVDYLLAPETGLDLILDYAQTAIEWFLENTESELGNLQLTTQRYYLFGRSAGAYLALYLAAKQVNVDKNMPHNQTMQTAAGIIALYGYFNLNEASFSLPSRHYLTFKEVSPASIQRLIGQQPLVTGSMDERFLIYLAARQAGNWMANLLPPHQSARDFSLSYADLKTLPKIFIAAASGDTDVPVRQSRLMSQHIPDAQLHIIDSDDHDFDRTQVETHGLEVYHAILAWLN